MAAHISGLFRYPIKGLSCEPLPSVALQPGHGVPGERLLSRCLRMRSMKPIPLPCVRQNF